MLKRCEDEATGAAFSCVYIDPDVRPDLLVIVRRWSPGMGEHFLTARVTISRLILFPAVSKDGILGITTSRTWSQTSERLPEPKHLSNSFDMALVGYSDSEGSDTETAPKAPAPSSTRPAKPAFQKVVDPAAPRRIKVDLPSIAKDEEASQDRPAKRARLGGGLSGFNSFLPAPKRTETAKKGGLGSGVNLKTSSAAAFSREPVEIEAPFEEEAQQYDETGEQSQPIAHAEEPSEQKPIEPPRPVGNPMKFRPLSVANKKKPKKKILPSSADTIDKSEPVVTKTPAPPPPKPKVSLFSVTQQGEGPEEDARTDTYEPIMSTNEATEPEDAQQYTTTAVPTHTNPNSLDSIATDLNLSAQERRRLFGRNAKDTSGIKITQFNTEAEYARNEELRAAGEATEHRAVKALAPGKHSLQQLVNAASTQKEALEDHWAEGKRNRSEGGSKYGWGK